MPENPFSLAGVLLQLFNCQAFAVVKGKLPGRDAIFLRAPGLVYFYISIYFFFCFYFYICIHPYREALGGYRDPIPSPSLLGTLLPLFHCHQIGMNGILNGGLHGKKQRVCQGLQSLRQLTGVAIGERRFQRRPGTCLRYRVHHGLQIEVHPEPERSA